MRGLKIQEKWLQLILSGKKTMEVRSLYFKIRGIRIALGNSNTGKVEGYATVSDITKIPYSQISNYETQHLATLWLTSRYNGKNFLYGYILKDVKKENNPFPYPKSPSICFSIKIEGTLKTNLRMKCSSCGHWNRVSINKIFIEQPSPELKVKVMIPMYQPLEISKCSKCGKTIAEPSELIRITK